METSESALDRKGFNIRPEPVWQPLESLASDDKRLSETLKLHGVRLNPNSRIGKYSKIVETTLEATPENIKRLKISESVFCQAVLEINQLAMIVEELPRIPGIGNIQKIFQKLVDGNALPQMDKKHALSRDLQFEYFLASHLQRCGFSVELAEPDLIVVADGNKISIAAKRPKSLKNMDKVFSDASSQIVKSGCDGLIGLDLSVVHNQQNIRLVVSSQAEAASELEKRTSHFIEANKNRIKSRVDPNKAFGMLIILNVLTLDTTLNMYGFMNRWATSNLCEPDDPRFEVIRQFTKRISEKIKV